LARYISDSSSAEIPSVHSTKKQSSENGYANLVL